MAPLTPEAIVVFAVILVALAMFLLEPVPADVVAIGVMVALLVAGPIAALFGVDLVLVTPAEGIAGFANPATITVLALFIISDAVRRTGVVQILGSKLVAFTRDIETRQLGVTIGVVAPISGLINNTAAVAVLLPMVTDLAHEGRTSPSKLLIPLSYASMMGGMLTLIGTSTNILASDVSQRLIGRGFSMFEFTSLGAIVVVVGSVYLLTIGRYLIPERIAPEEDLTEEFEMAAYLTEVVVRADSPVLGETIQDAIEATNLDVDVLQLVRDGDVFLEPLAPKTIRAGDIFVVRTDRGTLVELMDIDGFDLRGETVTEAGLEAAEATQNLVEIVVAPGAAFLGDTLKSSNFRQRYNASVLALRRGGELIRQRLDRIPLRVGDTLLVQTPTESMRRLETNRNFIVAQEIARPDFRRAKIPVSLGIVLGVVGLAALDVMPIVSSALLGVIAVVVTGCLRPTELYDAVEWDVVFLLAGLIPLGTAMESSGAADLLADVVVSSAHAYPAIVVLAGFYVLTALLTNVISNNASVILMLPVAYEAAIQIGANPFAFILAVTFAASTAFMTPMGYQTNLFVYGPGGYKFTDYLKVGTPLQIILTIVTTLGIAAIWGL